MKSMKCMIMTSMSVLHSTAKYHLSQMECTPASVPDFLLSASECDESSASDSGDQAAWHNFDSAFPAPAHHACFYPAVAAFPSDMNSTAPINNKSAMTTCMKVLFLNKWRKNTEGNQ